MKRCLRCEHEFDVPGWLCPACGFAPGAILGVPAFAAGLAPGDIGYDASRSQVLAAIEDRHFWFRARNRLIVWALRRHFPRAQSLLEVGCGTGGVLAALAAAGAVPRLAGSEAHTAALSFAARRAAGAELLQMDARRIPYREEFDVVAAFDVIEHIEDDAQVLREMFAACRRGGGIMLTVPQHDWLWSGRDLAARHQRRYARAGLLDKLAAAGFVRPWTTSFVALLLPLLYASRRAKRQADAPATAELEVSPAANAILGAILAAEHALTRLGVRWPAGGSLLAIARKP